MSHDTIICRCEDITLQDIKDLIEEGVQTVEEIKRICRCGMGPCGGKTCSGLLVSEMAKAMNVSPEQIKTGKFRPPAKNVKIEYLATAGEEE